MSFVAACSFCSHQLTVPDRAMGACVRCPKCGNYFTVAPRDLRPVSPPLRPAAHANPVPAPAPAPAPPPLPPADDQPWWVTATPQAVVAPAPPPVVPESPPQPPPPPMPAPVPTFILPEPPPPSSIPEWINPWGVFAFALACLVMLFAAFALPRWVVLCCAGLGLLLGLIGLAARPDEWKIKDAVWLVLGGGGCALLLLVGLMHPGWLCDRWAIDFVVPEPDGNKQLVVARDNDKEVKELHGGDRLDAATHAFRQGDLRLRVESAEVKRIAPNDPPVLLITLHIGNVSPLHMLTYRGQAGGSQGVVVRDSRGKELPRRELAGKATKLEQLGNATVLPLHDVKDLLIVEAPWSGTAHIEVDLPSAVWGREGVCKFTIPGNFIARRK